MSEVSLVALLADGAWHRGPALAEALGVSRAAISGRVAELRERVVESEQAVEAFRQQAGLIEGKGVTVASQQVSELNTQLILAEEIGAERDPTQ